MTGTFSLEPQSGGLSLILRFDLPIEEAEEIIRAARQLPPEKRPVTVQELMDAWNEIVSPLGLPAVRECKGSRRAQALARLREHPQVEFWRDVMKEIGRSKFLQGKTKPRGGQNAEHAWRVDFDFLVKNDRNAVKIAEGKYRD